MKLDAENLKTWVKDHKKEIKIAVGAAGITAFVYHKYGYKLLPMKPYLTLNISETKGQVMSGHTQFDVGDLTVKDLGKLTKRIQKLLPELKNDTVLNVATINYSGIPIK